MLKLARFYTNGVLTSEVAESPASPTILQKEDGSIDCLVSENLQGKLVQATVPSTPQSFCSFDLDSPLHTVWDLRQFSEAGSKEPIPRSYLCGVNGFTEDELRLAGEGWQQHIRTRFLGGVARFPNEVIP